MKRILIATALFAVNSLGATTLYVSPQGSDDATGSADAPLRTINKAIETLTTGGGGGG